MLSSGLYEQAINTALNREFPEIIKQTGKSMSVKRFLTRTIYIF